ncbi:MAG TPA: hypothetical protein VFJ50_09415, partial [Gemmatimonadales bacterium]|nr:hypothetical protein [Gemmatimonadales bacterium]
DSLARDPAPAAIPDGSFYDPYRFGFFDDQIRVSTRTLALGGSPARQDAHRLLLALSWGGRGEWDSALVNLDRRVATGTDSVAAFAAYGVAAAGVWLGAVDPKEAAARRPAAAQAARDATGRADLAWLDGVLAAARRDRAGLAQARSALHDSGDPASGALDRSLGSFDDALRGDTREAGKRMAALEWEEAALSAPDFRGHPLVMPLDRAAAAGWLVQSGDAEQALRLLQWVDGPFFLHPGMIYGTMLQGLADLERGRIEERLGHAELAVGYYRKFLARYDRPGPRHRALLEEARGRIRELSAPGQPSATH